MLIRKIGHVQQSWDNTHNIIRERGLGGIWILGVVGGVFTTVAAVARNERSAASLGVCTTHKKLRLLLRLLCAWVTEAVKSTQTRLLSDALEKLKSEHWSDEEQARGRSTCRLYRPNTTAAENRYGAHMLTKFSGTKIQLGDARLRVHFI